MKRIISLALCLMLILPALPVMNALAAGNEKTDMLTDEMTTVFDYIDVYPTPDGGIPDDTFMTRGDFAAYTAKVCKLTETDRNVYFSDVPRSNSNVSYINALADAGIIDKEAKLFRPDDAVTLSEAVKMAVNAIGYAVLAEIKGGYPSGYMSVGGDLDIIPSVGSSEQITHREAMLLLYNAVTAPTYTPDSFSGGNIVYEQNDETTLSKIWGIRQARGTLNVFYGGSIDGSTVMKDCARIGSTVYECRSGMYLDDMFANVVDFTYMETTEGERTLIWIDNAYNENDDCIIDAKLLNKFDEKGYLLEYYETESSNRKKSTSFDRSAKVYYNGSLYTDSISAVMNEFIEDRKKGTIRLKDTNDDGRYDTVIITSYRNIAVSQTDDAAEIYYNMADFGDNLNLADYNHVTVRNSAGNEATLAINDVTVLTVAESKDGEYLEIIMCDDIITDTVVSVSGSDEERDIVLSERTLKCDGSYPDTFPSFSPDVEYRFVVDIFGYVAYASPLSDSGKNVGLIISCYIDDQAGDVYGGVKMLTSDNEIKTYMLADRVRLDGTSYKGGDLAYNVFANLPGTDTDKLYSGSSMAVKSQAVRYVLNENEEITEIDSSNIGENEDESNTLTAIGNPTNASRFIQRYTATTTRFGPNMLYKPGVTKIFCMPRTDEEGYLITSRSDTGSQNPTSEYVYNEAGDKMKPTADMYTTDFYVHQDNWNPMQGYRLSDSSPYTDIIVITYEPYLNTNESLLFNQLYEAVNDDGEVATYVSCYNAATEASYEVADPSDFDDIVKGDLFRASFDETKTKIKYVTKTYDHTEDRFINGTRTPGEAVGISSTVITPDYWYNGTITIDNKTNKATAWGYYNAFNMTKGEVTDKIDNIIFWDWDKDLTTYEECLDFTAVPIMVIDADDNIRVGNIGDVIDYKSGGGSCSTLVFFSSYMIGKCGYIYNR